MTTWADVKTFSDVTAVGKRYLQKKVLTSPFGGSSKDLYEETTAPASMRTLLALHDRGVLTTDSQAGCCGKGCAGMQQKSYVVGFVDRRLARVLAAELCKVPGTVVYMYDYKTKKEFGNFKSPSPKQLKDWSDEYWILTRTGAKGTPRMNKWNPAKPPYSPTLTSFRTGKGFAANDLALAKHVLPGEYAGGSKKLHDIIRDQAAFFDVYNTAFGPSRPEAPVKMLEALKTLTKS